MQGELATLRALQCGGHRHLVRLALADALDFEGTVPNFNDPTPAESACKLLYVIGSRARKNLHLLSERGRQRGGGWGEYQPTTVLADCQFAYDKVP
ncbi:MAG: hypothetical protein EOQ57_20660 [Mesorhizobium sp.]|nr:MAG: hypothetical protein EOQ57_20660 [Mesorhizobium sp.]TGV21890.1 hypothetical protein EN786_31750 [Mesorhizobium sp. M4B.F.Ca.ET.143.01.1.1]TIU12064.1 MAG: hypothetical protein E5W49_27540 [Mesorhizobium sp.]